MKPAAIVLGICSSLWSMINSLFTYVFVGTLIGISSDSAEKVVERVEAADIVMWFLVLFFLVVGVFSCLVYPARILSGIYFVLAAIVAIVMTIGNLFMAPAVIGFILSAIFAFAAKPNNAEAKA